MISDFVLQADSLVCTCLLLLEKCFVLERDGGDGGGQTPPPSLLHPLPTPQPGKTNHDINVYTAEI